jgi:esterase/lipase
MKKYLLLLLLILGVFLLGCSKTQRSEKFKNAHIASEEAYSFNWEKGEFSDYVSFVRKYIRKNRVFLDPKKAEMEINANAPFELLPDSRFCKPQTKPDKGILLIHGLGDSPFSMRDIAKEYSKNCFLVRTVLLPGHGTKPGDSLKMTANEWYRVSKFAIKTLKKDVKHVYAGGFSTGANISTSLAFQDPAIKGLALFSPAFAPPGEYSTLVNLAGIFTKWFFKSPVEDYIKYSSFSVNSVKQFYITSDNIRKEFKKGKRLNIPIFIALSEGDTAVNVKYAKQMFRKHLISSRNRMIYFAKNKSGNCDLTDQRIICKNSFLPKQRIVAMSHMSIPNRPNNRHYGKNGDYRNCHVTPAMLPKSRLTDVKNCRMIAKEKLWYSPWGFKEKGKVFSRLTFNPYFDEMIKLGIKTLSKSEETALVIQK